jgi:hypothetical protein
MCHKQEIKNVFQFSVMQQYFQWWLKPSQTILQFSAMQDVYFISIWVAYITSCLVII